MSKRSDIITVVQKLFLQFGYVLLTYVDIGNTLDFSVNQMRNSILKVMFINTPSMVVLNCFLLHHHHNCNQGV